MLENNADGAVFHALRGRRVVPLPELDAYATALPHLDYVLADSIESIVLGRESVVAVRVPRPERLSLHKLWVATLRSSTSEKKAKDVQQGAVLAAALAEGEAGALEEAFAAFPMSAMTKLRRDSSRRWTS